MASRLIRLFGVFAMLACAPLAQEHAGPHWSYRGADGPNHWGELDKGFATCQVGHQQSPIDIRAPKAADLPPIQVAYRPAPLHIVNNGHTIEVDYEPGSSITVGDRRYELKQFHFHHPSEEKINGKGYAMVAHLVHAAADGSLAVVAVLLDAKGKRESACLPSVAVPASAGRAGEGARRCTDRRYGVATHRPGVLHLHRIPHDPALHRERDVVRPEGAGANLAGAG